LFAKLTLVSVNRLYLSLSLEPLPNHPEGIAILPFRLERLKAKINILKILLILSEKE